MPGVTKGGSQLSKTAAILMQPLGIVARGLVRGYQLFVSPVLPGSCRFYPTCSTYAIDAFTHHGFLKGGWMAIRRIARCHPWGTSDFDPVPGSPLSNNCCSQHGLTTESK